MFWFNMTSLNTHSHSRIILAVSTNQLLFSPASTLTELSTIMNLKKGDIIFTGYDFTIYLFCLYALYFLYLFHTGTPGGSVIGQGPSVFVQSVFLALIQLLLGDESYKFLFKVSSDIQFLDIIARLS